MKAVVARGAGELAVEDVEQPAAEHRRGAGHEVAVHQHTEGMPGMDAGQFVGTHLQALEQRLPQRPEVNIDQACVGVQQQERGPVFEHGGHDRQAVGAPDVVLVAQRDQRAAAGRHRLLEIARDAQRRIVMKDREADAPDNAAFAHRRADHLDAVVARAVVGQHDLDRQSVLHADAAHLGRQVGGAVARAQRDGDRGRVRGRRRLRAHGAGTCRGGQARPKSSLSRVRFGL